MKRRKFDNPSLSEDGNPDIVQEARNIWLRNKLETLIKERPEVSNLYPDVFIGENKKKEETWMDSFSLMPFLNRILLGNRGEKKHNSESTQIDLIRFDELSTLIDELRISEISEIFRSEVNDIIRRGNADNAAVGLILSTLEKKKFRINSRISQLLSTKFEERVGNLNTTMDQLLENLGDSVDYVQLIELWLQQKDSLLSNSSSGKEQSDLETNLFTLEAIEIALLINSQPPDSGYLIPLSLIIIKYRDLHEKVGRPFDIIDFGEGFKKFVAKIGEEIDLKSLDSSVGGLYFPEIPAVGRYDHDKGEVVFFLKKSDEQLLRDQGSSVKTPTFNIPISKVQNLKCLKWGQIVGNELVWDDEVHAKSSVGILENHLRVSLDDLAVHKFDGGYLFDHLIHGKFALSHMKGQNVGLGKILEEGFQVYLPDKHLAFYDGSIILLLDRNTDLVKKAPIYNKFPYIQGGIEFNNEALKAVIVPDNFKKYLLQWLKTWSSTKTEEVFGNRDPSELFITMAELHKQPSSQD